MDSSVKVSLASNGDFDAVNHWTLLAQKYWLKDPRPKAVKSEVIKSDIWDALQNEGFEPRSLLMLENLQLLERYLWPGYNDDSTNYHVLLTAIIATVKRRENLPVWTVFTNDFTRFSSFFNRVLSMSLDATLATNLRSRLLSFLTAAFQSLDNSLIRKECAPLVSISIWQHLNDQTARDQKFEKNLQLKKAWRAAAKRYEAAEDGIKSKLRFERAWLFSMMLDFISRLGASDADNLEYCERFLEFLTDLESQLPTRRYVNTLIEDLNLLALIKNSTLFNDENNGLFRDLFVLLRHFVDFSINDYTGSQYTHAESNNLYYETLAKLQRIALKYFQPKLTILALSNYGAIELRQELETHLQQLSTSELERLCELSGRRINYDPIAKVLLNRNLLLEILLLTYERKKTFWETIRDSKTTPVESTLYESTLLRNESYDGTRSLAIPKLNLQYLSLGDFLWRSYVLYRCESFFEIRKSMEETIKRLQPRNTDTSNVTRFDGFSRMAIPITKPAIIEVAPPKVGDDYPAFVQAEIALDVTRLSDSVRKEWEALRPDDVVYLLAIQAVDKFHRMSNGGSLRDDLLDSGLRTLRTAEVVQVLDENSRIIRENYLDQVDGYTIRPRLRRLIVKLDAAAYKDDILAKNSGKLDIYEKINLIVRRKGRENNFKKVLETIKSLALTELPLPTELQDVFLGYGDPTRATYPRLKHRLQSVDFRDTFLNWEHLNECFPDKIVHRGPTNSSSLMPPYILEICDDVEAVNQKASQKPRRGDSELVQQPSSTISVSTYRPPNNGPYPGDSLKLNKIRFTPTQAKAIQSGTQPGLTLIVGPPGTGKTDVATQIINNIYHNFPSQRTLLIAHSNQALNQLFQKIVNLDIDERHLLRLGHGEEDLETDANYGKQGRVESFLDNRARYLAEVDKLAANLGAPGAHGNSCETAAYFNSVYIAPAWLKFWNLVNTPGTSNEEIISAFPFHQYFHDVPRPLFEAEANREEILNVAQGCQRHVNKIFTELEDIRPFEILRTSKDKTNYLMVKEARIIAMTSTHAAMRRQEISSLGFRYENVIMEEAAQITEIENFIPLALQNSKDGESDLQRIVLCGDHLQNSPIIQNLAFRQFANLEQSMFLRLVRLGVPTITLDRQGRARPTIAELYKWRYEKLDNLPNVLTEPEFLRANAGFSYEYQFIDVGDYKGVGESQPSPYFFHNLGEAEYAVAIYQYMRLLGYPGSKISILTTYAGQKALIRDVLNHRCAKNRLFGLPKIVTTVDKYQGEQNDYIILSLTRTRRVGYLRDIRRLTVALSRARLGLYILGRRAIFESCYELRDAFQLLFQREDRLMLTTGELFPTQRTIEDEVEKTEMQGVEHLGQYVYEMSNAKVEALKEGGDVTEEGMAQTEAIEEERDEGYAEAEDIEPDDVVEELPE